MNATSLWVQWLELNLPINRLQVPTLIGSQDPTCIMLKNKKQNRNNIVTNSIKILKGVHIKKNLEKKKRVNGLIEF